MYDSDSQSYNDYYNFDSSNDNADIYSGNLISYKTLKNVSDGSDRQSYNNYYNFNSSKDNADKYSRNSYKTVKNVSDDSELVSKIPTKRKRNNKTKKMKTSISLQIPNNVLRDKLMSDEYFYCLKCNTRTESHKLYVVRDTYDSGSYRYRLCKTCKSCGSKGCKFLKTNFVDELLRGQSGKKIRRNI